MANVVQAAVEAAPVIVANTNGDPEVLVVVAARGGVDIPKLP